MLSQSDLTSRHVLHARPTDALCRGSCRPHRQPSVVRSAAALRAAELIQPRFSLDCCPIFLATPHHHDSCIPTSYPTVTSSCPSRSQQQRGRRMAPLSSQCVHQVSYLSIFFCMEEHTNFQLTLPVSNMASEEVKKVAGLEDHTELVSFENLG